MMMIKPNASACDCTEARSSRRRRGRDALSAVLLLSAASLAVGSAQAAPQSLRTDVSVRKIADSVATGSTSMRLARNPVDGALYTTAFPGASAATTTRSSFRTTVLRMTCCSTRFQTQ